MLLCRIPLVSSLRSVRRRPPVDWIQDATTYSDTHAVIQDPTGTLPYPEEDVRDMLNRTAKDAINEKREKHQRKKASRGIDFSHIPIEQQAVVMFPGQGSQFVGMGNKTVECRAAASLFEEASALLGYDLLKICTEGPKTKLDQTLYCQPAVFVSSLAAWEMAKAGDDSLEECLTDVAGFSVGEFAALVAAKMLTFADALQIVKVRAAAMHECNQLIKSGMMTVRVKADSRLNEAMADARSIAIEKGERDVCEIANYLFCGVRVVGASETCMQFLERNQKDYNITVVKRLEVSGAFHTRLMKDAVTAISHAVKAAELNPAIANIYSNVSGHIYPTKKREIRNNIISQVCEPVKWEQIAQLLYRKHQDYRFPRYMEVGPGRQLGSILMQTSKKAFAASYKHVSC